EAKDLEVGSRRFPLPSLRATAGSAAVHAEVALGAGRPACAGPTSRWIAASALRPSRSDGCRGLPRRLQPSRSSPISRRAAGSPALDDLQHPPLVIARSLSGPHDP